MDLMMELWLACLMEKHLDSGLDLLLENRLGILKDPRMEMKWVGEMLELELVIQLVTLMEYQLEISKVWKMESQSGNEKVLK